MLAGKVWFYEPSGKSPPHIHIYKCYTAYSLRGWRSPHFSPTFSLPFPFPVYAGYAGYTVYIQYFKYNISKRKKKMNEEFKADLEIRNKIPNFHGSFLSSIEV